MAYTKAKEVSESYEALEISFDPTTAAAVAKSFVSTNVQDALIEAKTLLPAPTTTVAGVVRNATDAEVNAGSNVTAFAKPSQIKTAMVSYINSNVIPLIPAAVVLPSVIYGGQGSVDQMIATWGSLKVGSIIVFDEYYTYVHGWGNGSSVVGAYRRRTITRTSNSGWQFLNYA